VSPAFTAQKCASQSEQLHITLYIGQTSTKPPDRVQRWKQLALGQGCDD